MKAPKPYRLTRYIDYPDASIIRKQINGDPPTKNVASVVKGRNKKGEEGKYAVILSGAYWEYCKNYVIANCKVKLMERGKL